MRRKIAIVGVCFVLCCFCAIILTAYAMNKQVFQAYEFLGKIYADSNHEMNAINYDLPVVTINGSTYVPLRQSAEKLGMDVEWDSESQSIILTPANGFNFYAAFERVYGIDILGIASVIEYDYTVLGDSFTAPHGEEYLTAVLSLDAANIEHIKSMLSDAWYYDELNDPDWADNHNDKLLVQNENFSWWKPSSLDNVDAAYSAVSKGTFIKTKIRNVYLVDCGDGKFLMYVSL